MALEQVKVKELVRQAVNKSVDVPEFQREFVWEPEQVKKLAESLYRDYPIGSLLLWDSSTYQEAKTAQGTQATLWIVDGQQRTTALCLLLGQKPYWWANSQSWNKALERYDVMVNILPDEPDDRLEFALPNPIRLRDPRWIKVREILAKERVEELTELAQKIVQQIGSDSSMQLQLFTKVHGRLQKLWQIRERDIPVVKIYHEVEDVAEIFARLNQEGTRVKEADVVLSLVAVHNPGWVREEYLPFRSELEERGWDLDAGIYVRAMTAIGLGRARLAEVPKNFWDPQNLQRVWKLTKETMAEVVKRLAEYGITTADLLPSTNSLIPLFALHYYWSAKAEYKFGKALWWFLLANRDGRYSGPAITNLNADVRTITAAKSFDEAIQKLREPLRVPEKIEDHEFLERYDRAGNRFLRLMLYLVLFQRGARDWVDRTRIGYDRTSASVTAGFEPQWHHIFPLAVLRKAKVPEDDMHALANITVLNERTNVKKLGSRTPYSYIKKYEITKEDLCAHLIPDEFASAVNDDSLLKEQWSVDRYGDFLVQRSQLLAGEANRFLQGLLVA